MRCLLALCADRTIAGARDERIAVAGDIGLLAVSGNPATIGRF
jgi:hypothetical protein